LVNFPFSDLSQIVHRPALVVQDETVKTGFDQWIVVQITTNLSRTGSSRVCVDKNSPEGKKMKLLHDSVIMADKIATLDNREISSVVGKCPIMQRIDKALRTILGL